MKLRLDGWILFGIFVDYEIFVGSFESKIFSSNFLEKDLEFFNNFFFERTWFGNEFGIHKWTIFNEGIFERNFQSDFLRL